MERKVFTDADVRTKGGDDLTCEAFISTEHRDRSGDILESAGMKIFGRVVVLLSHGQGSMGMEPVAKPLWIKSAQMDDGTWGIRAKIQFFPDEVGKRLWKKITEGVLVNWSIGWVPLDWEYRTERDGSQTRVVHEWELLEFSPVGVPMNPYAQTIYGGDKSQAIWFKILAPGSPVESGYKEISAKGEMPKTVHIPDELIQRVVKETIRKEINRIKGRVE